MTWFFAVLLVIGMGIVAVVATGRGGELTEERPDRPDLRVPEGRPVTAEDLEEVRFTTALRGYRMDEVDALLDRLAEQLRAQQGPGSPSDPTPPDPAPSDPAPAP